MTAPGNENPPRRPGEQGAARTHETADNAADHAGNRVEYQPRRLPPYARALADARRRGLVPVCQGLGHLAIVLSWDEPGPASLLRVVIPDDPAGFDLRFVAGLAVVVVHTDREADRVAAVVDALLAAGAARVEAINRESLARGDGIDAAWPRFGRGAHHADA